MLLTAIDVVARGESIVAASKDPCGSGSFGYKKTANGFELSSALKLEGKAILLRVGGG